MPHSSRPARPRRGAPPVTTTPSPPEPPITGYAADAELSRWMQRARDWWNALTPEEQEAIRREEEDRQP